MSNALHVYYEYITLYFDVDPLSRRPAAEYNILYYAIVSYSIVYHSIA